MSVKPVMMNSTGGGRPPLTDGSRPGIQSPAPSGHVEGEPCILIAEDHHDSREALRSLLEVYGYRVMTAGDGYEAVEKALSAQPDVILMDIMMPNLDGFEATRRLRASNEFRQVPIIALTAMEGAREMVLEAGCDDYLSKPIDVRVFLERVRSWAESSKSAR
jgi:two-component system, cell cycle response regulator DivK